MIEVALKHTKAKKNAVCTWRRWEIFQKLQKIQSVYTTHNCPILKTIYYWGIAGGYFLPQSFPERRYSHLAWP